MERKRFDWREFLILWGAGVFGAIAVLPYTLTLQGLTSGDLGRTLPSLPAPLYVVLAVQLAENAVLVMIAVGLGLLLAGLVGSGAPVLEARLARETAGLRLRDLLVLPVAGGVAGAVAIIALDAAVFGPHLPFVPAAVENPPVWQMLLASFYGGITEELLMRLFLMSLFAWLVGLVWRGPLGRPAAGAFWIANVAAAILFGLGHLPATAALMPITEWVIVRAIVLNGIPGLIFGYLYWKRGLEAAIVAHFSADIVLHVLTPMVSRMVS